jgi:hypothetical protein
MDVDIDSETYCSSSDSSDNDVSDEMGSKSMGGVMATVISALTFICKQAAALPPWWTDTHTIR